MADHKHDEDFLRSKGQRLTGPRKLVLDYMRSMGGHVTVDQLVQEATRRGEKLSVASAYRIVAWLTEQGLCSVTDIGNRDLVYEYLGTGRHHHLICTNCKQEFEMRYEITNPLIESIQEEYGFKTRVDHIVLFGTCARCQATGPEKVG